MHCSIFANSGLYCRNSRLTFIRLLDIDDFIENLWKIHVQVKSEGYVQVYVPYHMP